MNQLRIIKIIVLVFTCLLIAASIILLGSLSKKALSDKPKPVTNLSQPQGSKIKQIQADNGLLYIFISDGELADRIVIYNPEKKQIISNLFINEEQDEQK